jgi:hypothetical protein
MWHNSVVFFAFFCRKKIEKTAEKLGKGVKTTLF